MEDNCVLNDAQNRAKKSRINYIIGTKIQNLRRGSKLKKMKAIERDRNLNSQ